MITRLLNLVDGATGIAAELMVSRKPGDPRILGTVIGGVSDPRLVSVYRALVERGAYAVDLRPEGGGGRTNSTAIRTRQQMAERRAWRLRPDLDPWRTLDCEHFICSNQYLPSYGCVHLLILTRGGRAPPFDELDRSIVGLFHAELGRLWRHTGDEVVADLPPSLERTLELLLEGLSERQIVSRLQLSPHTIHDHVKRLYSRFRVNSRAQLLVRLSHCSLIRAPRLCVQLLQGDDDHRFDGVDTAEPRPGHEMPATRAVSADPQVAQA